MLTASKFKSMVNELKNYHKQYFSKKFTDLDESSTRLMINKILTKVLGYAEIEEIKTEFMIKDTYADYVIQIKGVQHFLVEVKSLSLELSEKHLRQAINYGANEGIEWAALTNGKQFELYKIIFEKPIVAHKVFAIDLSDKAQIKKTAELLQYLHRDCVVKKELNNYWNRFVALEPKTIAGILFDKKIVNIIKRTLKSKYKNSFSDDEVVEAIKKTLTECVDLETVKRTKVKKVQRRNKVKPSAGNTVVEASVTIE